MKAASESAVQQHRPQADLREQRGRTLERLAAQRGIEAEPDPERRDRYVARLLSVDVETSRAILDGKAEALATLPPERAGAAERIQGGSIDFVPASFLARGAQVARAVARVLESEPGEPAGSGFLVAPGVFLTNQHVLPDQAAARAAVLELDYEHDADGKLRPTTRYRLAPDRLFEQSPEEELDYTLVAVGERVAGAGELASYPYCPLRDGEDRHALGASVNVVQHPNGRPKEVSLRENRITARDARVLLYESDTLPGSSGSPVFNDLWDVVALHHYGAPSATTVTAGTAAHDTEANEGIRISAIVQDLKQKLAAAPAHTRLAEVLSAGDALTAGPKEEAAKPLAARRQLLPPAPGVGSAAAAGADTDRDEARAMDRARPLPTGEGTTPLLVGTIPLEVFVRVGAAPAAEPRVDRAPLREPEPEPAAEKITIDPDYANRRGYDPDFLGLPVALPRVVRGADDLAPLLGNTSSTELKYQHFSIRLNRRTRLACYTAVNIDGASWQNIDRKTGQPAREASEKWYQDPRVAAEHQLDQPFFSQTSYLFDRGHLVRRLDPTWGNDRKAIRANADTFHFTNASPQAWKFNQQVRFWQGIELYLLEHGAVAERERLTVFSGPLFEEGMDWEVPGVPLTIPARYWKVVARVVGGQLRASAFLADQSEVINDVRGERVPPFATVERAVREYRLSIAELEELTGLEFSGLAAHDAGVGDGERATGRHLLRDWSDVR